MIEGGLPIRFARPAAGAVLGLGIAMIYWLLDGWLTPAGTGLADCAAWFGGLGFAAGLWTAFEAETM